MRETPNFTRRENSQAGRLNKEGFFRYLTPKAAKDFEMMSLTSLYPSGAVLFTEQQESRGVFVVCEGEVKLTISSQEGKTLILRIAKPGEILGLMAVFSDSPYELTAEPLRPSQIAFVRRDDFLRFLTNHPDALQGAVHQLSANYHRVCEQLRTVGLSTSAEEKVARLLLEWSGSDNETTRAQVKLPLTHEEIAECIGSTRETVTRTLSDFRSRQLIAIKGSTLMIPDRGALEELVTV